MFSFYVCFYSAHASINPIIAMIVQYEAEDWKLSTKKARKEIAGSVEKIRTMPIKAKALCDVRDILKANPIIRHQTSSSSGWSSWWLFAKERIARPVVQEFVLH